MCQRWRVVVTACLAFLTAGCQGPRQPSLEEPAAEYVRLARLGDRLGKADLAAVERARVRVAGFSGEESRRAFLLAQLAALARRGRFLAGERITVAEEAASLGMALPRYNSAEAATLRDKLARHLQGSGTLAPRLAAHRRSHGLPRARLEPVADRAIATCRSQTPMPSDLTDGGVELRYVIDRSWPAFAHYQGSGRTVVEVRRDVAWLEDDFTAVLCHESYPGHHLQYVVWDQLAAKHGWIELTVVPPFTPHAAMAERAAVAAVALAMPNAERDPVSRILEQFAPLALATAVAAIDGELDRATALARLRDDLLMPDADGFLSFVAEQRAMAVAYVTPAVRVRDWQSYFALLRSHELLVAGAKQ